MARNGAEWVDATYRMTFPDQMQERLNGFRDYDTNGGTSATVTIPCPPAVIKDRKIGLALTDLHATGAGANAKVVIKSGTVTKLEFLLGGSPLQHYFATPFVTEPGEDLVVSVTGATSGASVTVLGHAIGRI